jgi:hypothetical protein
MGISSEREMNRYTLFRRGDGLKRLEVNMDGRLQGLAEAHPSEDGFNRLFILVDLSSPGAEMPEIFRTFVRDARFEVFLGDAL